MTDTGNRWADRAEAAHRGGQHSWAKVCEGRARSAWAREEAERRLAISDTEDECKEIAE